MKNDREKYCREVGGRRWGSIVYKVVGIANSLYGKKAENHDVAICLSIGVY